MDWFSWLSKTSLEQSLVYEYSLAFSYNELEEEDISYFNHEFLQSMGISIAKHRLEILKLARKEGRDSPHPMSRVLVAIKRTKSYITKYIRTWIHREDDSAIVVVPRPVHSTGWRGNMLKRNKKQMVGKYGRLLLTNASPKVVSSRCTSSFSSPALVVSSHRRINSFSSPMIYDVHNKKVDDDHDDNDDYWNSAVKENRWDAMFQNLKPT